MVSLNVVSVIFLHFSHSMLTTMVMFHNVTLEKHFYYTISMFQLIRVFNVQGECYFMRLLHTSSGGRVRSENR